MNLGGWGQLLMSKILEVSSRSSGVIQGHMRSNWVNIGVWTLNLVGGVPGWGRLLMVNILKVTSRSNEVNIG